MSIEYEYYKDKGYLVTEISGDLSRQQVIDYVERLINDHEITEPFYEIIDLSHVDHFYFGYLESDEIMSKFKEMQEIKKYCGSCLVANKDVSKGVSNIMKAVAADKNLNIQIFDSIKDAVKFASE